jgi:hypothetical protein
MTLTAHQGTSRETTLGGLGRCARRAASIVWRGYPPTFGIRFRLGSRGSSSTIEDPTRHPRLGNLSAYPLNILRATTSLFTFLGRSGASPYQN